VRRDQADHDDHSRMVTCSLHSLTVQYSSYRYIFPAAVLPQTNYPPPLSPPTPSGHAELRALFQVHSDNKRRISKNVDMVSGLVLNRNGIGPSMRHHLF
jgi:hypothetical protein